MESSARLLIVSVTPEFRRTLHEKGFIARFLAPDAPAALDAALDDAVSPPDMILINTSRLPRRALSYIEAIRSRPLLKSVPILVWGRDLVTTGDPNIITLPSLPTGPLLVRVIEIWVARYRSEHKAPDADLADRIIRTIEFPPEYYQSGMAILTYFSTVLRRRKLAEGVRVRLEQEGLLVRLVITTPAGQKERIERTLETYAMVVSGKHPIEDFATDEFEVLELRGQLRFAAAQLQNQRDMLEMAKDQVAHLKGSLADTQAALSTERLRRDEENRRFLHLLEGLSAQSSDLAVGLRSLAESVSSSNGALMQTALARLADIAERGFPPTDEVAFVAEASTIKRSDPSLFERVNDIFIKGALSGAAGNYLYSWLQAVANAFPK